MKDFFLVRGKKNYFHSFTSLLQLSGTREYMAFMAISEGYKNSSLGKMFIKIFLIKFYKRNEKYFIKVLK